MINVYMQNFFVLLVNLFEKTGAYAPVFSFVKKVVLLLTIRNQSVIIIIIGRKERQ